MELKTLKIMPAWEWPASAADTFLAALKDKNADAEDRMIAAQLAGDYVVIDDKLAGALLALVQDSGEPDELRAKAAISLGPALETADLYGFEDQGDDPWLDDEPETPISEEMYNRIIEALRELYEAKDAPKLVRRRALEASIRSRQDWHKNAVREAYSGEDSDWKLTAVFCMRFIEGFETEVLEALQSEDPDVLFEAVIAADNKELKKAWPAIADILASEDSDPGLVVAAIEAVVDINAEEAGELLNELADSEDEDIAEAAMDALVMLNGGYTGGDDGSDY